MGGSLAAQASSGSITVTQVASPAGNPGLLSVKLNSTTPVASVKCGSSTTTPVSGAHACIY